MIDSTLIFFVLLPASISDLYHYKVPNAIILTGLFLSLLLRVLFGGVGEVFPWLMGGLLPFFLCIFLYLFGAVGASDVKLFSVVGSFYHWETAISIVFVSFCFGAVFSALQMIRMKNAKRRFSVFISYVFQIVITRRVISYHEVYVREDGSMIPFSVCIALGTLAVIHLT